MSQMTHRFQFLWIVGMTVLGGIIIAGGIYTYKIVRTDIRQGQITDSARIDSIEAVLNNVTADDRLKYLDSLAEMAAGMEVQLRLIQEECLEHLRTVVDLEERIDQERELRREMLRADVK